MCGLFNDTGNNTQSHSPEQEAEQWITMEMDVETSSYGLMWGTHITYLNQDDTWLKGQGMNLDTKLKWHLHNYNVQWLG